MPSPRVAVLSLTRDRLDYSKACFASLQENAGIPYSHYVLDQGSSDGTPDWLRTQPLTRIVLADANIGIHRGHNHLLGLLDGTYDTVVTFDNDCEVTIPGTLNACHEAVQGGDWILSPTVLGLISPQVPGEEHAVNGYRVGQTGMVGGIFRTMPGEFASTFRFDESNPTWGMDEHDVADRFPGRIGYLLDWTINHYRTTAGQNAENPAYYARKKREMGIK